MFLEISLGSGFAPVVGVEPINGTFNRCAWEKANLPCNPLTKQFGMPDHVPIAWLVKNNHYAHCGGDACNPKLATCWGWCGKPNGTPGDLYDSKGNPIVAQGDIFDSGGGGAPSRTPCGFPPDIYESGGRGRPPSNNNDKSTNTRKGPCDLQRLAGLIMMRYGSGRPIATVKVVNSQRPTYLVLLPGMEHQKPGQATMAGDALIGYYNVAALDAYRLAIMDAVSKLPRGATLILAGHSLGGIEAQNVVQSLAQRYGFKVAQVVSFGAPVMDGGQPGNQLP